jgi:hypothetical protein
LLHLTIRPKLRATNEAGSDGAMDDHTGRPHNGCLVLFPPLDTIRLPETGIEKGANVIEERIQRAAEQILDDSSLTEDMEDAPATQLIEWGMGIAKRLAASTAGLDDMEAEEQLAMKLMNLRSTMRRINKLIGLLDTLSPEEKTEKFRLICEAAAQVPALRAVLPDDLLATQAEEPEAVLTAILSYLTPEESEDDTSQE